MEELDDLLQSFGVDILQRDLLVSLELGSEEHVLQGAELLGNLHVNFNQTTIRATDFKEGHLEHREKNP